MLKCETSFEIPEQTKLVAEASFPKGNLYMKMRDALGLIYEDQQFASLFSHTGQPAFAPWRLALITIMQFAEKLSDRQAADSVRARIDWKYALSLELTDNGFSHTVLFKFRKRLIEHQENELLFSLMLQKLEEVGLLDKKDKQRTDSTHIIACVRNLNRVELAGETLRSALNALASVEPEWVQSKVPDDWFVRYGQPVDSYRLPRKEKKLHDLACQFGRDGHELMSWIFDQPDNKWMGKISAVETLRLIWIQQFYIEKEKVYWRESKHLPPSASQLVSPYEKDARKGKKRKTFWRGYKVHITELCEENAPKLITNVETTLATQQDVNCVEKIHEKLESKDLLPRHHYVDQGYTSAKNLVESENEYGVDLMGPVPVNQSKQANEKEGFVLQDFRIDFVTETVVCPEGQENSTWREQLDRRKHPVIRATFQKSVCKACKSRPKCTTNRNGRTLTFRRQEEFKMMEKARLRQKTDEFQKGYKKRSGVEGALSQAINTMGMRRCRYRGLNKTNFQHLMIATAMNLRRALSWLTGIPCATTKTSSFAELAYV